GEGARGGRGACGRVRRRGGDRGDDHPRSPGAPAFLRAARRGDGDRAARRSHVRPARDVLTHMTNLIYTTMDSPIGELLLVGDGERLHRLSMQGGRRPTPINADWERSDDAFADVRSQLVEYFDGSRSEFDVPLGLEGNPFELRVWEALCQI